MGDEVVRQFEESPDRLARAALFAVEGLGYKVTDFMPDGAVMPACGVVAVSFKTGMSMKTWSGQKMDVYVAPVDGGGSSLRMSRKGSAQLYDWGEKNQVTEAFFDALTLALANQPDPFPDEEETVSPAELQPPAAKSGQVEPARSNGSAVNTQGLNKRVQEALRENLRDGEEVQVAISGASGQAIIGTQSRLFVIKPGFMAGATFGAETTSWSYRNLVGVQVHKGLMTGSVVVQAPGQAGANTSYWGKEKTDPYKAPNAIPVAGNWESVRAGVARLQDLIDDAHNPQQARPVETSGSVADELKKLAELNQSGHLTDEEFAAAKQRLIQGQ